MSPVDAWRLVLMATSLWMAALVFSLFLRRWRDVRERERGTDDRTHPLTYLSYALTLVAITGFRPKHFGEGVSPELVAATIIVVTGGIGIARRVRIDLTPPWRR